MTTPRLKAVLFDMDDTLIDWEGWSGDWQGIERAHLQAVYDFLIAQQRPLKSDFDVFREVYGQRSRQAWLDARDSLRAPHLGEILMAVLGECGLVADDTVSMKQCLEAYCWKPIPGVVVFPDVPAFLKLLREREIGVGIVTNASQPMWLREAELLAFELMEYFPNHAARISAADIGYLKPHETIFRAALEAVGATPEETVFIGDNPVADIAGAQAMGMKAVLRVGHPAPPLISGLIVPDAAINSFDELPSIFDTWFPNNW
jgi:HAD superfamily hydrolase (TIGR01509 family)